MDHGREWAAQVAAGIGERVAQHRRDRKLSAQDLADRCAELGFPAISRIVVTKLENGRRETVSTAELQVLARALGVPPILLLFPLGRSLDIEALPGLHTEPHAAIEWFTGHSKDPADPGQLAGWPPATDNPVALWDEHRTYEDALAKMDGYRAGSTDPAAPGIFAETLEMTAKSLRRCRQSMRDLGLTPPGLQPATFRLLGENWDSDGSR
jgi:transcriptional regulator with XRE-family HTH domain